jgi:hypothetical protein
VVTDAFRDDATINRTPRLADLSRRRDTLAATRFAGVRAARGLRLRTVAVTRPTLDEAQGPRKD